jgi:5-methylthioadenosine/S-adenosylhomocysteine deaminase
MACKHRRSIHRPGQLAYRAGGQRVDYHCIKVYSATMQSVDLIIHARWVIPVEPEETVLDHHCVVVDEGVIVDVLPSARAKEKYKASQTEHLENHALIPGLVNAHTHAAMNLFRGLADDLPLMQWLENHIWPAEGKWVGDKFVRDGAELAIAEMIRGGTTCFNDMYFFSEDVARAARKAHMRAVVGLIMLDFPSSYAQNSDEYLANALRLQDELRNDPLVGCCFAPHAPYTVSDGPLTKLRMLSDELDIPITMHVHETADEVQQAVKQSGERPLARLAKLDLLNPRLLAVHMTQLTDEEIVQLADTGSNVVHCPESNLKLASGFCPVARLIDAGVNVALGTDGAASNNDLDMFGEMRTAAVLAKGVAGDASVLPAHTVLRMATLNGARALGLEQQIGSIRKGKLADLVAVDLMTLESQPIYNPISQLVYAVSRQQVSHVWIGGKSVLHDRELNTLNESDLLLKARDWNEKIISSDGETGEMQS